MLQQQFHDPDFYSQHNKNDTQSHRVLLNMTYVQTSYHMVQKEQSGRRLSIRSNARGRMNMQNG